MKKIYKFSSKQQARKQFAADFLAFISKYPAIWVSEFIAEESRQSTYRHMKQKEESK